MLTKEKNTKKENRSHRKKRPEARLQVTAFSEMELCNTAFIGILYFTHILRQTEAH